jgi:hypothetical protein
MRIRDTLSSESEHVKARAPGPQWRDLAVRRRRSSHGCSSHGSSSSSGDGNDDGWCEGSESNAGNFGAEKQIEYEYTSYEMPDHSILSYVTFIPFAIMHSLRNMAKGDSSLTTD